MHFSNIVIIKKNVSFEDAVALAMDGMGDFYQIGGRWTGLFDGYDPEKDPANIETCELCGGTGDRATYRNEPKKEQHASGCNGCLGTGKRVKWPTQWDAHPGDVASIEVLTDKHIKKAYRIVTPDETFESERYDSSRKQGDRFVPNAMPLAAQLKKKYPNHLIVVVDNHS